ncbi:conserved hypothetical protein [Aspergillus nidulans FGSC A4]|uniref:DNA repair protein Rad26 n=2 Tax=Emericella nidulans TaxID=162425 RepID=G5EB71_EMENI|nr:protein uvsD [Aspergillus nidulans FGSC A4]AAD54395.1 putative rad26 homolog uvsD [Aspergillus nidulans]EAA62346.1 conserved hypothetical protein [Aspergillus nidulans FGSC A4]CBF80998.1 TPA: Putative rad26 homolog uvsDPutative uncharacterized protein; [Source:UniProtKB/TrEMBL;Acc:Q9UV54] [Aspergillus nidulans FGSC A4]|eukprot:XP_662769.1 conserved hypothetical protein [Aspergillus nidulans FGSC A4]
MENFDDDVFSDDGFDDLPPDALEQLEQDAFRATQAEHPTQREPEPRQNWAEREVTIRYAQINPINVANATLRPPAQLHTGLTNDYGSLDVGESDAEVFDDEAAIGLNETVTISDRPSHYAHDSIALGEKPMETDGGLSFYSALQREHEILTAKLQQETERYARLENEFANVKSLAETKTGEIAIIRSNHAKIVNDYERQLSGLRKAMDEETAKHREELEAIREQGKTLATENAFLKQDLAEEVSRVHQIRAKMRTEEKSAPVTPKKPKALPFRDGFDDEEILAVSPSKSGRSKQATPTVTGKKRRRTSQGSPSRLHLSPHREQNLGIAGGAVDEALSESAIDLPMKESSQEAGHQDTHIIKQILNHRTVPHKTDIEIIAELAFPSEPGRTLYSILLEETTQLDLGSYAMEHMRAIISLWSRALKEKFYKPIPILLETTRLILAIDATAVLRQIDRLIPVLLDTSDINGVPRFKHSPYASQSFGKVTQTPASQLEPLVDSTEVVRVLYQIACRSLSDDQLVEDLWRHIRYSFVLMMLSCSQPASDIKLTLSLLMTSVRPNSFASIQESEQDQKSNENWVVDRVASLMWETLQPDEGQPPYTRAEICDVRLEALAFLMTVTFNPIEPNNTHGSLVIASHHTALAKLVRAMHDELDALYSYPPERDMHSAMVNGLMRLIYSIIQRHPKEADLQLKLHRVPGGKQKFLVVLTRLAFSEGIVLEAGIEDETVEMAHSILDDAVNPQEAEALLEAFPHAKGEDTEAKNAEDTEMMEVMEEDLAL